MASPFSEFLRRIAAYGLEAYGIFYGSYRGVVKRVDDPLNRGRIMVHVPQIHGDSWPEVWANPKAVGAGPGCGLWAIPDVGDCIWVEFDHGRPEHPIWSTGWWSETDASDEDMTTKKVVLVVKEGMKVVLDRENQTVMIEQSMGNSVFISDEELRIQHAGKIIVDGENCSIQAMGDTEVRAMGSCMLEAMDELTVVSAGKLKIDGADSVDIGSTATVKIHSAGLVDIQSDASVSVTSAVSISVQAPTLTLNGNVNLTGNFTMTGNGNVTGNWITSGINSAHHSHPVATTGTASAQTGTASPGE